MTLEIALLGNPNCGKTTLFNELTGDHKTVGNWSGVTVTLEVGHFQYAGQSLDLVDLPGLYSLFTPSPEQHTVCEYLNGQQPGVILNVLDATNLARNLYLTTQLLETGLPLVLALNMSDELHAQGLELDLEALSGRLGVPCVLISATKRTGLSQLLDLLLATARAPRRLRANPLQNHFPAALNAQIDATAAALAEHALPDHLSPRWAALQLLAGTWPDAGPPAADQAGERARWQTEMSEARYRVIQDMMPQVVKQRPPAGRCGWTRRLDRLVCHPVLALSIFLLVMLAVFALSFGFPGSLLTDGLEWLITERLPQALALLLTRLGAGQMLQSLLLDGIIRSVGGVLVFCRS